MKLKRGPFVTGAAATFAGIGIVRSRARAVTQMKFGTNVPINDPRTGDAILMTQKLRQATNGRIDIKVYYAGALGSDTQMLTQVRSGALEFMTISPGILANVIPVAGIEGVPYAFKSVPDGLAAFDGALGQYVRGEIEAKGIGVVGKYLDNGFRQITSSKGAIHSVDDIQGMKVRVPPGKLWIDVFKTFGTEPVGMNWNEVYTALQTHIVDGQENPYQIIETSKIYEVQKYLSVTNHMWGGYWVIANQDAWKALGPDQAIVNHHMLEYADMQRRDTAALNAALADKLGRQGLAFTPNPNVGSFKAKLGDFYTRWKAEYGDKAWGLLEQYTGKLG